MNKKPLRIALFTSLYAPFLTGVSVAVHQRANWLLEQGHFVFLIHPQINDQYPKNVGNRPMAGLEILRLFPNFSSYAFPTKPLIFYNSLPQPLSYRHWSDTELLKEFQPDIIMIEEAAQIRGFYSLFLQGYGRPIGQEYAKSTGIPTVSLFHTDIVAYIQYYLGNQVFRLIRPILPSLIKQFTENYDLNLFPSKGQLLKYQQMKSQRSEYIPYQGVNCKQFHSGNIAYNPIPNDNRFTLLFVGRICPEKNVSQLFDIYKLVAAKINNVHMVIIGSGPLSQEIEERGQNLAPGLTVWGESHGEELLGWYARADLFVNPSVTENFCTTNMEALASGTPVVAAIAPSSSEQIISGENGFLAEANNSQDFANKIIHILENPELKLEMSRQARLSILEFDWSACMEKLEEKLYRLCEGS